MRYSPRAPAALSDSRDATGLVGPRGDEAMLRTRRHLLSGSAALGGAAFAAACGGAATPAAPAAALDTPASIVWLNWEGSGVSLDGNTRSVSTFQAKYPKIKIEN